MFTVHNFNCLNSSEIQSENIRQESPFGISMSSKIHSDESIAVGNFTKIDDNLVPEYIYRECHSSATNHIANVQNVNSNTNINMCSCAEVFFAGEILYTQTVKET